MSTATVVALVFLAVLIAWVGLVLAGLFSQLRAEVDAEGERRRAP